MAAPVQFNRVKLALTYLVASKKLREHQPPTAGRNPTMHHQFIPLKGSRFLPPDVLSPTVTEML